MVFGADHVYRMDPRQMVDSTSPPAPASRSPGIRVPRSQADQFGVIDDRPPTAGGIDAFLEKPADPPGLPDDPDEVVRLDGQLRLHAPRR